MQDPTRLRGLSGAAQMRAIEATEQLFNYCAGWGVVNDPPEDDELATLLGIRDDKPHLRRAHWIRNIAEDDNELGRLVGRVMALTMPTAEETAASEDKDATIARLQAQLNEAYGKEYAGERMVASGNGGGRSKEPQT